MATLVKRKGNLFPSLMSDFFSTDRFFNNDMFDSGLTFPSQWIPAVNIEEGQKDFKITLSAPGMAKSDFKVNVENDVLTISSEKEEDKKEEGKNWTRREYSYGSFSRSFNLPEGVNSEKIDARYENGILSLTLPKKADYVKVTKAREIAVH